jgi:hypothetical protein
VNYLDFVIGEFSNTPEGGCSSERESIGMNTRIQELNCERAIPYHTVLSDELIQTLAVDDALTIRFSVGAVIHARRLTINGYAKSYRFTVRGGTQNEMQIAGVKPIYNAAIRFIENRIFTPDRPVAR